MAPSATHFSLPFQIDRHGTNNKGANSNLVADWLAVAAAAAVSFLYILLISVM